MPSDNTRAGPAADQLFLDHIKLLASLGGGSLARAGIVLGNSSAARVRFRLRFGNGLGFGYGN